MCVCVCVQLFDFHSGVQIIDMYILMSANRQGQKAVLVSPQTWLEEEAENVFLVVVQLYNVDQYS